MFVLSSKKLIKNLLEMEEMPDNSETKQELKKLFLILAGDKKTMRECSLDDIAYFFNESYSLLSQYNMKPVWEENHHHFRDYIDKKRRAL